MLTDNKVKSLKPKQKRYSVADAKGLSIDGGQWRADVIERQLAHVKNDVRRNLI